MSISKTTIRVRYAETDQLGVVYYANYFVWFEVGRAELLRQLGFDYKQMEIEEDCHIAVVEASCRYKAPARYDDELTLETSVLTVHRSILKFAYRLLRMESQSPTPGLQLLAEGETTHAVVSLRMRRASMPKKYLTMLEGFMAQSSDSR